MEKNNLWFVYIVQTSCNKLYTGITTNTERRFQEHCDVFHGYNTKGAKFFRGNKPIGIVYVEECNSRSAASKREYQIKSMSKHDKLGLLAR
jgi:putative endonuclease